MSIIIRTCTPLGTLNNERCSPSFVRTLAGALLLVTADLDHTIHSNYRIGTSDGIRVINKVVLAPYEGFWIGAFIEVEFDNLKGDFEPFNGLHLLSWGWHSVAFPFWSNAFNPVDSSSFMSGGLPTPKIYVVYFLELDGWLVYIEPRGHYGIWEWCHKAWRKEIATPDLEGDYVEYTCDSTHCNDATSCAQSSGATCRVKWAGATWI